MRRLLISSVAVMAMLSAAPVLAHVQEPAQPAAAEAHSEDARLNAFFEEAFQARIALSPQTMTSLGIKTDQHNPLDEHPDLRDKVQTGLMDEQDALELARLRTHQGAVQQRQQRQVEEQTLAQRHQSALDQMAQWGAEQRANDPDFGRKLAAVKGAIDAALPALPPEQWVQHAAQIIGSVQLPAAAPPQARPRPGRAPMRHSNAAAGAATVTPATPTDPMDAFTQGVEEMRAVGK